MTSYQNISLLFLFMSSCSQLAEFTSVIFESWIKTEVLIFAPTGRSWYCSCLSVL